MEIKKTVIKKEPDYKIVINATKRELEMLIACVNVPLTSVMNSNTRQTRELGVSESELGEFQMNLWLKLTKNKDV